MCTKINTHKPQPSKPRISKKKQKPTNQNKPKNPKELKNKANLNWAISEIEQQKVGCDVLWDWDLGGKWGRRREGSD